MQDRNVNLTPGAAHKLADALMRRRVELGIRSARMFGEQTGLDYRTITSIEGCRRDNVSRNTLAIIEMNLNWPAGYLNKLLEAAAAQEAETTVELSVPEGASSETVLLAREIAQATFNATIRKMSNSV